MDATTLLEILERLDEQQTIYFGTTDPTLPDQFYKSVEPKPVSLFREFVKSQQPWHKVGDQDGERLVTVLNWLYIPEGVVLYLGYEDEKTK